MNKKSEILLKCKGRCAIIKRSKAQYFRGGSTIKNSKIRLLCITGVFAALVFVVTAYLHIPTVNGYVHVGDGLIYLAACILPLPYAIAVGACGALLADCLTGYAIWAPCSVIVKAASAALFSSRSRRIVCFRNLAALLPAAILCIGGYYLYEALLYGNFVSPLAGMLASLTQAVASSALFIAAGLSVDKMGLKSMLNGGKQP